MFTHYSTVSDIDEDSKYSLLSGISWSYMTNVDFFMCSFFAS